MTPRAPSRQRVVHWPRALLWAAAFGIASATAFQLITPAIRIGDRNRYVIIADALRAGWPNALISASCPHLYMRADWLHARCCPGDDAEQQRKCQMGQRFCATKSAAGSVAGRLVAQVQRWPLDDGLALWLPANGADAACVTLSLPGDVADAWLLRGGEGAQVSWQPTEPHRSVWRWPGTPSASPGEPIASALADVPVVRFDWPPSRATVQICGPALLRGTGRAVVADEQGGGEASL